MKKRVPNFRSREEEVRFWQDTDLEKLAEGEWEEVKVDRPQRPLSATFAIRFDPKMIELLRQVARAQGVGVTQLVRAWVLERLRLERSAGVLAKPTSAFPSEFELNLRQRILGTLMRRIPEAVEEAMQDVLEQVDLEASGVAERD